MNRRKEGRDKADKSQLALPKKLTSIQLFSKPQSRTGVESLFSNSSFCLLFGFFQKLFLRLSGLGRGYELPNDPVAQSVTIGGHRDFVLRELGERVFEGAHLALIKLGLIKRVAFENIAG